MPEKISLVCCHWHCYLLHTCNNDDNKLVIFSGIALYYGDTYTFAGFSLELCFQQVHDVLLSECNVYTLLLKC